MSNGTIEWDDWERADNWEPDMDHFRWNGRPFTAYLVDAMRKIELHILSGRIFNEAVTLVEAHSPIGFDLQDMIRLLRDGEFPFTPQRPLVIHGGNNGLAGYWGFWNGGRSIQINFGYDISSPNPDASTDGLFQYADRSPTSFPQNSSGSLRLEVLIGATILHEIMHVVGFHHGDPPSGSADTPSHEYNRTLPEVVGQAFGNIYFSDFHFLNGGGNLPHCICRTRTRDTRRVFPMTFEEHIDVAKATATKLPVTSELSSAPGKTADNSPDASYEDDLKLLEK